MKEIWLWFISLWHQCKLAGVWTDMWEMKRKQSRAHHIITDRELIHTDPDVILIGFLLATMSRLTTGNIHISCTVCVSHLYSFHYGIRSTSDYNHFERFGEAPSGIQKRMGLHCIIKQEPSVNASDYLIVDIKHVFSFHSSKYHSTYDQTDTAAVTTSVNLPLYLSQHHHHLLPHLQHHLHWHQRQLNYHNYSLSTNMWGKIMNI